MIHADLVSHAVVNRLGFCDQLCFICCRQRDEFDAGFLGLGDLIIMLLPGQRTGSTLRLSCLFEAEIKNDNSMLSLICAQT